jgi:RNA polymerase sigma-70 factor (ECF subfamily)
MKPKRKITGNQREQAGPTQLEYHQQAVRFKPPALLPIPVNPNRALAGFTAFFMRPRWLPTRFAAELPAPGELPGHLHPKPNAPASAPSSPSGPGKPSGISKSPRESAISAQPSTPNRVPEGMATLVMDNPGIGSGRGTASGNIRSAAETHGRTEVSPVATERTDAEIMLAVAAGDEAGYNYLVTKYHRQIIHFLFRMVHNEAVAEELAQEVFLRVYRSRESYRAEAKFSTWLYRIATNLAVNHARDTKNERTAQTLELDAPDAESGTMPEVADDDPNVEQRMLREERMEAIRAQVRALPERQRMAVLMHKYQEMDYRQIGEVLKLSESATKSLLFRAYQTLRERLKEFV